MAWNGSDQSGRATSMKSPDSRPRGRDCPNRVAKGRNPSIVHLLSRPIFYLIFVVALGGAAVWWFFGGCGAMRPAEAKDTKHASQIATVTPAKAREAAPVTNAPPAKPKRVLKTYRDERGILRYEGGLRVVKHWPKPPQDQMNTNPHLFENHAEFEILGLVTTKPGTFLLDIKYNKKTFEKAFVESLKHKIEILPDDTPEVKEQKLATIEAKKTLEEAYKRGEDVTEMMNQARKELVRLNRYRDQLIETASEELSKEGTTDKDLNDWVDAMNSMLDSNGIKPIKQKELARDILRYQRRTEARKKAEAAKKAAAEAAKAAEKN